MDEAQCYLYICRCKEAFIIFTLFSLFGRVITTSPMLQSRYTTEHRLIKPIRYGKSRVDTMAEWSKAVD